VHRPVIHYVRSSQRRTKAAIQLYIETCVKEKAFFFNKYYQVHHRLLVQSKCNSSTPNTQTQNLSSKIKYKERRSPPANWMSTTGGKNRHSHIISIL
jgi:hypothetical protein